ncbi:MAG: hypothetical protein HGA54_01690 [Actinobacteria bacterium]|nr:hypothetical protein [Actinomycetota bacterium]
MIAILQSLKALLEQASGICYLGMPASPSGGDTWLSLNIRTEYDLESSGGVSQPTHIIEAGTIVSVTGGTSPDFEAATALETRLEDFKELLEADVTLAALVEQARIKNISRFVYPLPDGNAYEAGAVIEIEVRKW